jgi:polyhydroxyalkanoate synthesis regulator phasin
MSTKKKIASIVITTVALTAGTVGVSSAASKSQTTRVSVTQTSAMGIKGPRAEVAAVLAALVTKGTITQAQADAITAALTAAEAAAIANRPAKVGRPDPAATIALISSTIGVDAATIQKRLAAGETLAAIAGAKKDALIAALVADETKRIDAAVTAGKLTAAQATTMKSTLTAHVTEEVNSTRPLGGKGGDKGDRGGKFGKGGHGPKGGVAGTSALTLPATPTA